MSYSVQQVDDEFHRRKQSKPRGKILKQHVDTSKVNLPIVKGWLEEEMQKHLLDDDIAVELIYEMLEGNKEPAASEIQEQLVTFLGEDEGRALCEQLWQLLVSGQKDKDGIPEQLLEKRKQQMEQQTRAQAKAIIAQMRPQARAGRSERQRQEKHGKPYERGPERRSERPRPEWRRQGTSYRRRQGTSYRRDISPDQRKSLRDRNDESADESEPKSKKTNYNRSTRGTFERDDAGYRRNPSLM